MRVYSSSLTALLSAARGRRPAREAVICSALGSVSFQGFPARAKRRPLCRFSAFAFLPLLVRFLPPEV